MAIHGLLQHIALQHFGRGWQIHTHQAKDAARQNHQAKDAARGLQPRARYFPDHR